MIEMQLSQGKTALVDDLMYEYLKQWKWHATKNGTVTYACRNAANGSTKKVYMHTEVMVRRRAGKVVDHIDGNGLNNQRSNLRYASKSENALNTHKLRTDNTSGERGVHWDKNRKKWLAQAVRDGKHIFIGRFASKTEALKAYNKI